MKKRFISFVIFVQIILLTLGVGIFSFKANELDFYGAAAQEVVSEPPKDLAALQLASDEQLEYWALNLDKFDGRTYDYVTKQKNQGGFGLCWAYAAVGAVEASILREGIDDEVTKDTLDLDELIAGYARYNRDGTLDPLNLTNNDTFSESNWRNSGGFCDDAFMSMSQGYSLCPQATNDSFGDEKIRNSMRESKYYVEGYIPVENSVEAIKQAIIKYGSVTMEYKAPESTIHSYVCHTDQSLGHASLIVGWDDTITKDKFSPDHPENDGAWIVKNSWGAGGANSINGTFCFYLSYESYIHSPSTVDMGLKEEYPNVYYYDGRVDNNDTRYITDAHGVIFEAKLSSSTEQEQLKAVAFGVKNNNLSANIKIYRNVTANACNVNDKTNDPSSGQLALSQDVFIEKEGFYTIDLKEPINLNQNEYFSIVISGTDQNGNPYYPIYGSDLSDSVNDMTYRLYKGVWTSCKDGGLYVGESSAKLCARIRAITDTVPRSEPLGRDLEFARVDLSSKLLYYEKGRVVKPEVKVYFDGEVLEEDEDYTLEFMSSALTGVASVKITGQNTFTGERIVDYEIAKPYLPPGETSLTKTIVVYNNVKKLSDIPVPDGWAWDNENETISTGVSYWGYTLRYIDYDKDCYQHTTCSIKVDKRDEPSPDRVDFSLEVVISVEGTYIYSGNQIIPTVKVTLKGNVLTPGIDYVLSYLNNTNAGQATVIVTGNGLYKGEARQTFQIKKANKPFKLPDQVINISLRAQYLRDVDLNCAGWKWNDSSLEISSNPFYAVAVYDGLDKDNFENLQTQITIVREEQKDISEISELRLEKTIFVYDGLSKSPNVIARDGYIELRQGVDFNVSYQNNKFAEDGAVAVVIGINSYSGSARLYFTIEKAERNSFKVTQPNWTYGDEFKPNPAVTGEEEDADGLVISYSSNENGPWENLKPVDAGVYWIKVEIAESKNYKRAESVAMFTIFKRDISGFELTIENKELTYSGGEIKPKVSLKDGEITLEENKDYTLTFENNINAGKNAKIKAQGIKNYSGTVDANFEIKKATKVNFQTTIHVDKSFKKLSDIELPDDFEWDEESLTRVSKNVMKATARYFGTNFDIESLEFEIVVDEASSGQGKETALIISISVAGCCLVIGTCILCILIVEKRKGIAKNDKK